MPEVKKEQNMREEILKVMENWNRKFEMSLEPIDSPILSGNEETLISEVSDKIISIFEDKKMTYEEAYIILEFVYQSLKYKSQKVNL